MVGAYPGMDRIVSLIEQIVGAAMRRHRDLACRSLDRCNLAGGRKLAHHLNAEEGSDGIAVCSRMVIEENVVAIGP